MPGRKIPLENNYIYHIINRGLIDQLIFLNENNYIRALGIVPYYQQIKPVVSYSRFTEFSQEDKNKILQDMKSEKKILVEIIAFCFMPTHL